MRPALLSSGHKAKVPLLLKKLSREPLVPLQAMLSSQKEARYLDEVEGECLIA
jgi:hypothetical protein